MIYLVTAYRWGYLQESETIYASESREDCFAVAEAYPDWRGGKYGCGIFEVDTSNLEKAKEGDAVRDCIAYFPSIHGEFRPIYNHRCDVFNDPICKIMHHEEYESAPQWIKQIIEDAKDLADKLNALQTK